MNRYVWFSIVLVRAVGFIVTMILIFTKRKKLFLMNCALWNIPQDTHLVIIRYPSGTLWEIFQTFL